MLVITEIAQMQQLCREKRQQGLSIGLVPTMGYLHEGHLSLMRRARQETDVVTASVFVNPTQFGPSEDLARYPRDLEADCRQAEQAGVDILFCPTADAVYPEGYVTYVEPLELQDRLCGKSRPGHFRGVCTVVLKLFNIVQPDKAYFGQKDAQQYLILRRMTRDLNLPIDIVPMPIVREADGLAMSSRNVYLKAEERVQALALSRALRAAQALLAGGERDAAVLRAAALREIGQAPLARIDYVEIVDMDKLLPLERIEQQALLALAVYFDKTRLIDNAILQV